MRRYFANLFLMILFTGCVLLISIWFSLSPSIKPTDVSLSGELKKEQLSPEPKLPTKGGYIVEISLDNLTNKPLSISDRDYFSMVYLFVNGFKIGVWDFFKGPNVEVPGYTFGSDSRVTRLAANKLEKIGYAIGNSPEEINEFNTGTLGFTYTGNEFPTRTRVYLSPIDKQLTSSTKAYLVYTHYQKKWGRDLSWTKVEPIKIVE